MSRIIKNSAPGLRGHACISTADGHPVSLTSLITGPEDIDRAAIPGTHGVGLLNTDFLYAGREELPAEEEQWEVYTDVVSKAGNRPVSIMTCSLGAGRMPQTGSPDWEKNPDLGLKGLRLGLAHPEILKAQLRAIFRANARGHIHLLLPLISTPREILELKALLGEVRDELAAEGAEHRPVSEIGIRADLPSVVVNAALFSFNVSFFQIGDELRNYTMGADFSSAGLQDLLHEFEPAFLFQVQALAEKATRRNKTVSLSSGLAARPEATPILLALGVQDLVMPPEKMGPVKKVVESITIPTARVIASKAMSYWAGPDVQAYARESLAKYI